MYKNKKVLAIIPARRGSKRLPFKNIMDLNGRPLIAWTIQAAKKSQFIDTLIVSTDDNQIANISKQYDAEVPFIRPKELASDTSTTVDVIFHALNYFKKKGITFEYIILLQPTSPLRTVEDIDKAFGVINEHTKSAVSVCETEHSPLWSNILPKDLSMKDFIKPEIRNMRSQDLPKYYRLNGAIYLAECNYFSLNKGFLGENTKAYIMPQLRSVDIDTNIDFKLAEIILIK